MNIPGEALRITKPLRCTSLHQTILANSPSKSGSFTGDPSPLQASLHDSDNEESSEAECSSDNDSLQSDSALGSTLGDNKTCDLPGYLESRRNAAAADKRQRRASSGTNLRFKNKGLSLNYTSPTTAAHAIHEVFTKRESLSDTPSKSPEAERASFLAELPEAIARARKVHYRRDALLPKTMSFNRVQNSLKEEGKPFESDIKKEATLAKILKEKAAAREEDTNMEKLDRAMASVFPNMDHRRSTSTPSSPDITSHIGAGNPLEETLFTMEDVNFTLPATGKSSETHRKGQTRAGRPTKRKNEESRYEPYSTTNKRRAISPSPASPLGSPMGKGSIFRIEDLTL